MKQFQLLLASVVFLLSTCNGYRILAVFPFKAKSHNILFEAVTKTLAKHGHQIDVITHFPRNKPLKNYNEIIHLHDPIKAENNLTIQEIAKQSSDSLNFIAVKVGNNLCHVMGSEEFQKLIRNPPRNPPYDLVIVEAFGANCFMGLGHVFKVPVVAISSSIEFPWVSQFIGNVDNLAIVPNAFHVSAGKMNFLSRLKNVYSYFAALFKFYKLTEESQTESMRKFLSPDIPNIRKVEKSVALTLVNTHPTLFGPKPVVPSMVQIAGLHIEVNEETLSADLKKWMDESNHGVVYFSFGSAVLIESLPKSSMEELYASFKKINPIRVLMKIVDKSKLPVGLPKNVKTMYWLPQQSVLAHPNTKIFITHGGLGGIQEALYYGVPMIGVPLFSDQFKNVDAFTSKGMMIRIDFDKLSGKTLDTAFSDILSKPDFKKNAIHHSKLFKDRPMSAVDTTIFWVEYVIRNGGIFLKSPALEFAWWQLYLLDVYGFVLLILILIMISITLCIKAMIKLFIKTFVIKTSYTSKHINKKNK